MSLLGEIAAQPAPRQGGTCGVAKALQALSQAKQADLLEAIAHREYDARRVAKVLQQNEIPISYYTINRHRKGDCKCPS